MRNWTRTFAGGAVPILVLVFVQAPSVLAAGHPECVQALHALAERYYNDRDVYCQGACGLTVARLLEKMAASGWDLSKAKVIFVLYERNKVPPVPALIQRDRLAPVLSRENDPYWFYHAFIEYEGHAVDLHTGTPVGELGTYLERVFPRSEPRDSTYAIADRLAELYIRPVEAEKYLQDFRDRKDDGTAVIVKYRNPKDSTLPPIVTARNYLNHLP